MKIKLNTDRIIGLTAMLVGLLTLIIFIYQTSIIRKQSRLSVTPRLVFNSIEIQRDSVVSYSMELINKGLGPGIIESINIIYEGKSYDLNFGEFLEAEFPDWKKYGLLSQNTSLGKGATLSTDEKVLLFTFEMALKDIGQTQEYFKFQDGEIPIKLETVYSSIYEESWKTNNKDDNHPEKL
ncbi:MAG: hypothetical protein AAFQ94_22950 [Bacteroidota bacterium]